MTVAVQLETGAVVRYEVTTTGNDYLTINESPTGTLVVIQACPREGFSRTIALHAAGTWVRTWEE